MTHHAPLGPHLIEQFLQTYWQKRPLFIADAIPQFHSPLSAEELAGLACEEEVESRIVCENPQAKPSWQCRYGPFTDADFARLPQSHWTLLVQECNKYHPDLALLLDRFNFIPNWRIDDIMVSYAPVNGSVGPHLDQYDVFLIQAQGHRRWQINTQSYNDNDFIEGIDLHILKSFEAEQEWLTKPGDILYLPPGVAHYGVAQDDCITISVGFRAPSVSDLLSSYTEHLIQGLDDSTRYTDPDLQLQADSGELSVATRNKIRQLLQEQLNSFDDFDTWFGCFATDTRQEPHPESEPLSEDALTTTQLLQTIDDQSLIHRSEYSRFGYIEHQDHCDLFIDGQPYTLDNSVTTLVKILCNQRQYRKSELEPYLEMDNTLELLTLLFKEAKLYIEDHEGTYNTD